MRLNFEFKEKKVYGDKANITFCRLSERGQEIIDQIDRKIQDSPDLMDIIVGIHTSDEKEMTSITKVANATDEVYIWECRREWDRFWDYFRVSEYKERCFPKDKGLLMTTSEREFLTDFLRKYVDPLKITRKKRIKRKEEK